MMFPQMVSRIAAQATILVVIFLPCVPAAGFVPLSLPGNNPSIELSVLGTWRSGLISSKTPAGPVYDPRTERVFVGSDDRNAIDVIDVSMPKTPTKVQQINLGGDPSSIAFSAEGILAVTRSSSVRLFNSQGAELVAPISVPGAGNLRFTPDGQKLVISGKRNSESEINILDLESPDWDACRQGLPNCSISASSSVASFNVFNNQ